MDMKEELKEYNEKLKITLFEMEDNYAFFQFMSGGFFGGMDKVLKMNIDNLKDEIAMNQAMLDNNIDEELIVDSFLKFH